MRRFSCSGSSAMDACAVLRSVIGEIMSGSKGYRSRAKGFSIVLYLCRVRLSKKCTYEIEYRSIGAGEVSWKAISLHNTKVQVCSISFCFFNKARFANPRLTTKQSHLSLPAICVFNNLMYGYQLACTTNHYWANGWLIERHYHVFRSFLALTFSLKQLQCRCSLYISKFFIYI